MYQKRKELLLIKERLAYMFIDGPFVVRSVGGTLQVWDHSLLIPSRSLRARNGINNNYNNNNNNNKIKGKRGRVDDFF